MTFEEMLNYSLLTGYIVLKKEASAAITKTFHVVHVFYK